ncbi:hypothetical protein DFH28DRAFT_1134534 [Melampsora americana]|nr:hypothetical protein DFH28DRAFT_1134534 [Melampsora americana]
MSLVDPQTGTTKDLQYDVLYTLLSLLTSVSSMVISFSVIGMKIHPLHWYPRRTLTVDLQVKDLPTINKRISDKSDILPRSSVNEPVCARKGLEDDQQENLSYSRQELDKRDEGFSSMPNSSPRKTKGFGIRSFISGILCGAGVSGMHFISQAGVVNEKMTKFNIPLVILSVVMSCAISWIGFWVLFVKLALQLRQRWYKRLGVAALLAVSCAMSATSYYREEGTQVFEMNNDQSKAMQAAIQAIINIFLPMCGFIIVGSSICYTRSHRRSQALRQRILLAACVFDERGNVLTTVDGRLPVRELKTGDELPFPSRNRTFGERILGRKYTNRHQDLMSPDHPAFLHCMRRSWHARLEKTDSSTVDHKFQPTRTSPVIISAERRLQVGVFKTPRSPFVSGSQFMTPKITCGGFGVEKTVIINLVEQPAILKGAAGRFVETFSQTWTDIVAKVLGCSAPNQSGPKAILYDRILEIGYETSEVSGAQTTNGEGTHPQIRGNGQMMFMIYQTTNRSESAKYETGGYCFSLPYYVCKILASDMAISTTIARDTLRDLLHFYRAGNSTGLAESVVYCGLCVAQALPYEGLHLLVDPLRRHSIPMLPILQISHPNLKDLNSSLLPITELSTLFSMMKKVGGLKYDDIVASNAAKTRSGHSDDALALITSAASALCSTLLPTYLKSEVLKNLRLYPQLMSLNSDTNKSGPSVPSYLICFRTVISAEVEIPMSDAWSSFESYSIQSEGVGRSRVAHQNLGLFPDKASSLVSPSSTRKSYGSTPRRQEILHVAQEDTPVPVGEIDLASIIREINSEIHLRSVDDDQLAFLNPLNSEEPVVPWTTRMALQLLMKSTTDTP